MEAVDAEGDAFPRDAVGPHAFESRYHPPAATKKIVCQPNKPAVWYRCIGGATQSLRDSLFGCVGVQGAQRDKCRCGRAAEASIAMYEQRSLAIPRLHEVDELGYMLFGGCKCSGAGLDDVVHI